MKEFIKCGDVITWKGRVYQCVEDVYANCGGCQISACAKYACSSDNRPDRRSVMFVEVEGK